MGGWVGGGGPPPIEDSSYKDETAARRCGGERVSRNTQSKDAQKHTHTCILRERVRIGGTGAQGRTRRRVRKSQRGQREASHRRGAGSFSSSLRSASADMPNFAGTWKMRSSENFDELLKALGKPSVFLLLFFLTAHPCVRSPSITTIQKKGFLVLWEWYARPPTAWYCWEKLMGKDAQRDAEENPQ